MKLFHRKRRNSPWKRCDNRSFHERLESRCVLAGQVVITEVVTSNQQGLEDDDDQRSDWIELYNAGDAPVDLNGWHLTDDAQDRTKWTFPAISILPESYLVVFASGSDRRDPALPGAPADRARPAPHAAGAAAGPAHRLSSSRTERLLVGRMRLLAVLLMATSCSPGQGTPAAAPAKPAQPAK